MAEIEHFCDPKDKGHPKFATVADYKLILYSACNQMDGKSAEVLTIGEAVKSVIFNSIFSLVYGCKKLKCSYTDGLESTRKSFIFILFQSKHEFSTMFSSV